MHRCRAARQGVHWGCMTPTEAERPLPSDPGIIALVMLLQLQGVRADGDQIRHRFGDRPVGVVEMIRWSREAGLKARTVLTGWSRLAHTPMPAIAALRDGGFVIIGQVDTEQERLLIQEPLAPRPRVVPRAEFEAMWSGRVVLVARRATLSSLTRRFDITWFLGAISKYRRLLGEVLVASFVLQLFALISPLFFQVVIDKVLAHRVTSTLDVLVIGLAAIAEALVGFSRRPRSFPG